LRLKKKGPPQKTAKPPEPGERRVLRKRIVLSNTNALAVDNVEPLKPELAADDCSKIYTLPAEILDQLRAIEAFKPKQGWAFFRTPAVLMRQDARALGIEMDQIGKEASENKATKASRKVVCGEKGAGKSVLLLQAMAMAFQRGWIVINLPEGMRNICSVWRVTLTWSRT
jgi:small subunit ribosomal protein S29